MATATTEDIQAIKEQLAALTRLIAGSVAPPQAPSPTPARARASYSVDEAAGMLGRRPFTVREWCRLGQCNAYKLPGWKSGPHDRWRIAGAEVERLKAEGLLPADAARNRGRTGDH